MPVSAFVSSISGKGPLLFCHRIPLRLLGRGDRADQDLLFFLIQLPPRNPPVCDREEGSVRYRKDLGDLAVPGGSGGVSRVRASDRRVGPLDSLGDGGLRLIGKVPCHAAGQEIPRPSAGKTMMPSLVKSGFHPSYWRETISSASVQPGIRRMAATPAWTAVSKRKTLPLSGSSARSKSHDLAAEGTAVLPHRGAGTCQLVGSQDRAAGGDAGDPDPAPAEQQKTGPSFRKGPVFVQSCAV